MRAAFRTSNNIRTDSPVRIAGVDGRQGHEVERDGRRGAIVTMQIDDEGRPIHADAHAAIRPRIFLEGNFFVDLQPGTPSAPVLGDGDMIPVNQTSTPVQLDQILTALQSDTREDLQVVLKEYAGALKGRGARGYRRSLRTGSPPTATPRSSPTRRSARPSTTSPSTSRGAAGVAAALDRSPPQLKALITDFNTTAARVRAQQASPARPPSASCRARCARPSPRWRALNAAFPPLRGLVRDLRPGVRNSLPGDRRLDAAGHASCAAWSSRPELRGLVGGPAADRPAPGPR